MQIKIYNNIADMQGTGEEWLVNPVTQDVLAVFIDGDLRCQVFQLNTDRESTKVAG